MISSEDGWAAAEGALYHYDGTTWQLRELDDALIDDIDALSATDIWAMGSRPSLGSNVVWAAWHYDGVEWQLYPLPSTRGLQSIEMLSSNDVWASTSSWEGGVFHYDGTNWQAVSDFLELRAISMLSADDG